MERDTKSTPLVTIAIPIYNAEKYLRYAIQSCINQTYQNWELLLMCDGSTDTSIGIMEEMAAYDSRIRVIYDDVNKGLVYRLNQSIKLAKGKYYARMDADDIMAVNRIEEEVNFLELHTMVDVVGTSMMMIDGDNHIMGSSLQTTDSIFVHPSVMGKTSWFLSNPYDEAALRAEDFDLWNRTRRFSAFANIESPLMFYRIYGMPTTRKMLLSYKTMCRLTLRYKEYHWNILFACRYFLIYLLKICVLIFLSSFNKQSIIIKKRKYISVPIENRLTELDLEKSITSKV